VVERFSDAADAPPPLATAELSARRSRRSINTRRAAADSVKPTHTLCPKNAPGSTSGNLAKTYFTVRKVKKFATKLI